jgi:hypothetical protein
MILSESYRPALLAAITATKPTSENIALYREFQLTPADFGSHYTSWEGWLNANGGPAHTGVTLAPAQVRELRVVMQEFTRFVRTRTNYEGTITRLSQTTRDMFQRLGIRPSDVGIVLQNDDWAGYRA